MKPITSATVKTAAITAALAFVFATTPSVIPGVLGNEAYALGGGGGSSKQKPPLSKDKKSNSRIKFTECKINAIPANKSAPPGNGAHSNHLTYCHCTVQQIGVYIEPTSGGGITSEQGEYKGPQRSFNILYKCGLTQECKKSSCDSGTVQCSNNKSEGSDSTDATCGRYDPTNPPSDAVDIPKQTGPTTPGGGKRSGPTTGGPGTGPTTPGGGHGGRGGSVTNDSPLPPEVFRRLDEIIDGIGN